MPGPQGPVLVEGGSAEPLGTIGGVIIGDVRQCLTLLSGIISPCTETQKGKPDPEKKYLLAGRQEGLILAS